MLQDLIKLWKEKGANQVKKRRERKGKRRRKKTEEISELPT